MVDRRLYSSSPLDIALVYGVLSGAWIFLSDRLVATLIDGDASTAAVQTTKGWLFVLASSVLLFALLRHGQRSRRRTNERLDRALQQTSVLHRVLRHNLRNSCNVIAGNAELIGSHVEDEDENGNEDDDREEGPDGATQEHLDTIRAQTEQLETLTEKTRLLRDIVLDDGPGMPDVERAVLEEGMESPMFHSEGWASGSRARSSTTSVARSTS